MKKLPWGIFAGISAIVAFFSIIGTVASFIILDSIAAQTTRSATLFDEWYQTALFVLMIISVICLIGSVVMYVINAIERKKLKGDVKNA